MISIIVSIANNGCIGGNNTLLWRQSEDLKRFKAITEGKVVVMGQKTYESLPKRPLPKRTNIVISNDYDVQFEGCQMAYSIEESLEKAKRLTEEESEIFVIGGGSIYRQFLPHATKLYITRIDADVEGDTYFPDIDENKWFKYFEEYHPKDEFNQYNYTFEIYRKLK